MALSNPFMNTNKESWGVAGGVFLSLLFVVVSMGKGDQTEHYWDCGFASLFFPVLVAFVFLFEE